MKTGVCCGTQNRGSGEAGVRERHAAACEKHGDYQRISLTGKAYRGVENVKHSQCPECVKAELAGIESSLRTLRVADLIDNAGIARRFEACEFDNYRAINQDAAKISRLVSVMPAAGLSDLMPVPGLL